jgi:glycosyltransferase involved in cell wall biosynthesis
MRIGVTINDFVSPWAEGEKNRVRQLAKHLSVRHELFFMGISDKGGLYEVDGNESYLFKAPFYRTELQKAAYLTGYFNLILGGARILRRKQPDVVLSMLNPPVAALVLLAQKALARVDFRIVRFVFHDWYSPVSASLRTWTIDHLPHLIFNSRFAFALSIHSADHIVCTTEYMRGRVQQVSHHSSVSYVPNAVDLERFQPDKRLCTRYSEEFVLAYIGHLTHVKGFSLLLEAVMPLLDRLDLRLVAAVTFGAEEKLRELISNHPRISLYGIVKPETIYNASDLVVLPRRYSHGTTLHPLVMLEAMACQTPVLSSDLPEICEVIEDGKNGFLFRTNDVQHLRSKIEELYHKRDALPAVGVRARQTIERHFDPVQTAGRLEVILKDVL